MGQPQNNDFKNKVCIITGGAGSIGLESAKLMHESGANIMLVDRDVKNLKIAKSKFCTFSNIDGIVLVKLIAVTKFPPM